MSSISPIETKKFAKRINELGCDYLDAPVSGGEVGAKNAALTIMVGGAAGGVRQGEAALRADGQEHHAGRRQRRRSDLQGRNQIIVALNIEAVGEALRVRVQGRRRPGEGAPGADGRLCRFAHPRSARRAHDQAHVRSGLPHRAASEGSVSSRWPARARSAWRCPIPRPRRSSSTPAAPTAAPSGTIRRWSRRSSSMANHDVAK